MRLPADLEAISMRISGEGMARWGLAAVANNDRLYDAEAAISAFHDALLAVARGHLTPEKVRDFFWKNDLDTAKYHGGVLLFTEEAAAEIEKDTP